jgi:hypothetical protein
LKELEERYEKLSQLMEFNQESSLEYHPKYTALGAHYFQPTNVKEDGLKFVHQLD